MPTTNWATELLTAIFPEIKVLDIAKASGQRVVLYCEIGDKKSRLATKYGCPQQIVAKLTANVSHTAIAYYEREVEFLSTTESPSFPKLYHYSLITEDPRTETPLSAKVFLTIEEFLNGKPLSACPEKYSDPETVIELLANLVTALTPLWDHPKRFVHRDLKPDNIIIKTDGSPSIIDLGIVREAGATGVTATVYPHGPMTPRYASPEQIANLKRDISFKSDFFALGIIAYELLAKRHPLVEGDEPFDETLSKMVSAQASPLHKVTSASEEFSAVIGQMIEKAPYKRQRTIEMLAQQIHNCRKQGERI